MTYSIWKNHVTGDHEVVRLVDGVFEVVQTNIRTWQKAQEARKTWEARENEHHGRK
jgi:hypothetical protein